MTVMDRRVTSSEVLVGVSDSHWPLTKPHYLFPGDIVLRVGPADATDAVLAPFDKGVRTVREAIVRLYRRGHSKDNRVLVQVLRGSSHLDIWAPIDPAITTASAKAGGDGELFQSSPPDLVTLGSDDDGSDDVIDPGCQVLDGVILAEGRHPRFAPLAAWTEESILRAERAKAYAQLSKQKPRPVEVDDRRRPRSSRVAADGSARPRADACWGGAGFAGGAQGAGGAEPIISPLTMGRLAEGIARLRTGWARARAADEGGAESAAESERAVKGDGNAGAPLFHESDVGGEVVPGGSWTSEESSFLYRRSAFARAGRGAARGDDTDDDGFGSSSYDHTMTSTASGSWGFQTARSDDVGPVIGFHAGMVGGLRSQGHHDTVGLDGNPFGDVRGAGCSRVEEETEGGGGDAGGKLDAWAGIDGELGTTGIDTRPSSPDTAVSLPGAAAAAAASAGAAGSTNGTVPSGIYGVTNGALFPGNLLKVRRRCIPEAPPPAEGAGKPAGSSGPASLFTILVMPAESGGRKESRRYFDLNHTIDRALRWFGSVRASGAGLELMNAQTEVLPLRLGGMDGDKLVKMAQYGKWTVKTGDEQRGDHVSVLRAVRLWLVPESEVEISLVLAGSGGRTGPNGSPEPPCAPHWGLQLDQTPEGLVHVVGVLPVSPADKGGVAMLLRMAEAKKRLLLLTRLHGQVLVPTVMANGEIDCADVEALQEQLVLQAHLPSAPLRLTFAL
eukprot:TRINITY_DN4261_c0_g1_i2.p1 TRINITY_DN4261_c0_g1~~TRINITY_DN4261_c0_g1_i2.p1  ORF type:complete len:729 (-),score=-16.71 TRINITY_DN4261_c0_g1_i2:361-2547(-)